MKDINNFRINITFKMDIKEMSKLAAIAEKRLLNSPQLVEEITKEYIKKYELENGPIKLNALLELDQNQDPDEK